MPQDILSSGDEGRGEILFASRLPTPKRLVKAMIKDQSEALHLRNAVPVFKRAI
jgi:hypothetical protein